MTWFTGSTCYGAYDGIFIVTILCDECNHENRGEAVNHVVSPAASTDVAVYYNSLHHIPDAIQHKAIAETARVLSPGGLLCIVEPEARGSCHELLKPVDDESAVYTTTYNLIFAIASGDGYQQLHEERFLDDYIYRDFKQDVCLSSISGGTDIISCFVLGNPSLPVYKGDQRAAVR